ncbi:two-component sensor histidine kinase [Bacteroides intestinalis]|jgi:signal transduction histidine kinase|uniref:sensor histidine kinase n=1 Tax=Bacteroides intestinalis TaxID=329854 RepID=UPI000E443876|nr:ATP-binding protein [Bacteroides intestinalis]RGK23559.1 two-component sensor histidine kinase [Bacteroides intestinalis]
MDTASKLNNTTHFLSFSRRLFLSVISLFLVFAGCFLAYQYQREKEYKVDLLDIQLQDYNERLHQELARIPDSLWNTTLERYLQKYIKQDLRITVVNVQGDVLYDSYENQKLGNHINRPEVQKALAEGKGYDVRRTSETTGVPYFYSATLYEGYIIRSALPYDLNLVRHLAADQHYIWFTVIVSLLLIFIFYKFTSKLGTAINQLREFAKRADKNEPVETDMQSAFPHNELGEISQHIIQIYKRLRETKEALYIEREKLITHLQTSHEGLGVFNKDKKEILVNNLFTQYSNLISDSNLQTTEEIFSISEFQKITDFINKAPKRPGKEEKRMSISINKNGRMFIVECIIFQDLSFEISINDITQEEEQIRLKRQLTQNIAHELKTPVSSIQGYLETIVNNENISREKMQTFIERCYAQSNRLSRLLRDISVLTRMDEAANMIDMEKVDISLLVGNIVNEVSLELEEKHITVVNSLKPKIQLRGNYSLLYSIFRNLMDNAIAYAGTDIRININCFREDENFYYFSFADTGVGVSPEHLNRLFERFYRVDKGRSRKLGGTGLGLAIVKNSVIIHGGTISAKNNQGGGLEFVFTLAKEK